MRVDAASAVEARFEREPGASGAHVVDDVARCFETASSGRTLVHRIPIAGAWIELRSASGVLLEQVVRALGHLEASGLEDLGPPALTIFLWDGTAGDRRPEPLTTDADDQAEGAIYYLNEPPVRAAHLPVLQSLSVFDDAARRAWFWVADADAQPYWERAAPIRQILFWWLESQRYVQVHGAAVGTPEGGVLIVGKGGSGKSTIALSSLTSDLLYAGDDYVAYTLRPFPTIQSIYNSGKLEPHQLRDRFPDLAPRLDNRESLESEKAVIFVHEHFPERTTAGFPLRAIVVPTISPDRPDHVLSDIPRASAFAAIAPSTVLQLHTAGPEIFSAMSELVRTIPCFRLTLGTDVASIPETIRGLLEQLPEH